MSEPADNCELSTYGELADVLVNLATLLREGRRARRLSLREAARQIGCSASTLQRFENGSGAPDMTATTAIVRWLGAPPRPGLVEPE